MTFQFDNYQFLMDKENEISNEAKITSSNILEIHQERNMK